MRIWDLPVSCLCRNHLLGEHGELHLMWLTIKEGRKAYANHPETNRWRNNLLGLWMRHEEQAREMKRRGYKHKSDLDLSKFEYTGFAINYLITPIEEQIEILKSKKCDCDLGVRSK